MNKKCYFLEANSDDHTGLAVVAQTESQAKNVAFGDPHFFYGGNYIDLQVWIIKDASIEDLDIGTVIEPIEGLKRGVYTYADGICPICHEDKTISMSIDLNIICCSECEDKLYARDRYNW